MAELNQKVSKKPQSSKYVKPVKAAKPKQAPVVLTKKKEAPVVKETVKLVKAEELATIVLGKAAKEVVKFKDNIANINPEQLDPETAKESAIPEFAKDLDKPKEPESVSTSSETSSGKISVQELRSKLGYRNW